MTQTPQQEGFPPQHQDHQPGHRDEMTPRPRSEDREYRPADKLHGDVALITGGDSGIGRAVAIHYAKEGADVAIGYLDEAEDARDTKREVEDEDQRCLLLEGDVGDPAFCREAVERTVEELGGLDILVNNAAEQHERTSLEEITPESLERTFRTNIFGYFYMAQAALPHLEDGKGCIINTTSVTAYKGSGHLLDYSATKGAIVAFTRSLSQMLVDEGIRVNGVAPGPVWTPLIPASFPAEEVAKFGTDYPMHHAAQPEDIAPTYVFLACDDAEFYTGQVLHPNAGKIVGG